MYHLAALLVSYCPEAVAMICLPTQSPASVMNGLPDELLNWSDCKEGQVVISTVSVKCTVV